MNDLTNTKPKMTGFQAVLFAGMLLFAFYASTHMVAAGDTWVALACGRHFDHHGVDTVEPFSFNSHPAGPSDAQLARFPAWTHGIIRTVHPTGWLNQNWLTHLQFYQLADGADGQDRFNRLVYWKFAIYFATVFCVYALGRTLGAGPTLAAAAACLAMVVGRSFYDIRPAGYSNLLTPAFLLILAVAVRRHYRWIWLAVPLIVYWANVHGGYIYAFLMFVPFIGIHLLLRLNRRWTFCLGLSGLWGVLYLISHQLVTHEYYRMAQQAVGQIPADVSLLGNGLFGLCAVLIVGSAALTLLKRVPAGLFYVYHILASVMVFFTLLLTRLLPAHPHNLNPQFDAMYGYLVTSSQLTFLFVVVAGGLLLTAMAVKKDAFAALPVRGLGHAVAATGVSLLAMVVLNPFHLTNITHTFEISVSKHAESWRQVNEWKPAFDWMDKTTTTPNPVGNEEWFAVLCGLTLVTLAAWLAGYFLKPRPPRGPARKRAAATVETAPGFAWPTIPLAVIVVALLTVYMAIRSRRFIPMAGAVAAPVLAMLLWQAWQMISARIQFNQTGVLAPMALPKTTRYTFNGIIIAGLAVLAVAWGGKYKRIYLDPWPTDHRYDSVFMRMTASHLKPTDACAFIGANGISGKVFNYWTEGGAVAFGQTPDPETGHIPLKLFMDGRAQAAYDHATFRLWQEIFSGGPLAAQAQRSGTSLTTAEWVEVGNWITEKIGPDVWVVLMPLSQQQSSFMRGLTVTDYWKTAYIDDYQQMLVNVRTDRGQSLIQQILQGTAVFPNDYAKNLTTYTAIVENQAANHYDRLYRLAADAFGDFPTPSAMVALIRLHSIEAYRQPVLDTVKTYLEDFSRNFKTYRNDSGYAQRLSSAGTGARFLASRHPEEKAQCDATLQIIRQETDTLRNHSIW